MNIEKRLVELLKERGYETELRYSGLVDDHWCIAYLDKKDRIQTIIKTDLLADQEWMVDDPIIIEEGHTVGSFKAWMIVLDKLFVRKFGQSSSNFDDYNWDDEWSNDVPPEDAFEEWKCHTESGTRSPANF